MLWFKFVDYGNSFIRRFILNPIINWWKKQEIDYIQGTITYEEIKIRAQHIGKIPQLVISFRITNRSMTNVKIARVFGELHIGKWRVDRFNSEPIQERHSNDCFSDSALIIVAPLNLKKRRETSDITITLFPPTEFWIIEDQFKCSLRNAGIEFKCSYGNPKIEISKDDIQIEGAISIATAYRNEIKKKLDSIVTI